MKSRGNFLGMAVALSLSISAGSTLTAAEVDTSSANHIFPGCVSWTAGKEMTTSYEAKSQGRCMGSIQRIISDYGGSRFCIPERATRWQKVRVVVVYIQQRPERMHEDFEKLALEAWTAVWPCQRS